MDDEDGMESFEVDDMDLEFAMNPGRRVYQSKNQATYGGVRFQSGTKRFLLVILVVFITTYPIH